MRWLIYAVLFLLVNASHLHAISSLTKIERVKIKESGKSFRVKINFNKAYDVEIKKPLLGGNYIQYTFKNTYVNPSKQLIRASGKVVEKALLYQFNKSLCRLRIFIDSKKLNRKMFDKVHLEKVNKNNLYITYRPSNKIAVTEVKQSKKEDLLSAIDEKAALHKSNEETIGNIKNQQGDESLENFMTSKKKKKASSSGSTGQAFGKMLYSLGMVIGLVLFVAWMFRKVTGRGTKVSINNKMITFITREYIGPKNYLALVKVMNKYLLIGVSNDKISALSEFDEIPEEYKSMCLEKTKPSSSIQISNEKIQQEVDEKLPANSVFKKIIKDVSTKIVNVKDMSKEKKEKKELRKTCKDMTAMGENVLKRRRAGLDTPSKGNIDDPFIRNLSNMIKDRVKDLPEI